MASKPISFRPSDELAAWLTDRSARMHEFGAERQARTELGLWQATLQFELRRIRLTLAEAICLASIFNSTVLDATVGQTAFAEVYDAFRLARETPLPGESSYEVQYGIDEKRLTELVGGLGPAADHALRDAFSRWWAADREPNADSFRAVGLTIVDPAPPR
ncbi:hypothetical protein [Micromonospora aurantiaca (nom. illeg.)]|uniref:hypothetical protein n=1 Tax=Micromonospora aurantiaca (nom. illeg.) TaxID=47850 RepID=UPI0033CE67BA